MEEFEKVRLIEDTIIVCENCHEVVEECSECGVDMDCGETVYCDFGVHLCPKML